MSETETNVKSVVDWAEQKKTERWLLCVAATAQGWLPEQEDDCVDEVTEAVFDAAIKEAQDAHQRAKVEHGRDKVRTILHDSLYIGFIVRRLEPTGVEALNRQVQEKTTKDGAQAIMSNFRSLIQYPDAKHLDRVRDIVGQAVTNVLPLKWFLSLGAEGERRAKKR